MTRLTEKTRLKEKTRLTAQISPGWNKNQAYQQALTFLPFSSSFLGRLRKGFWRKLAQKKPCKVIVINVAMK